MRAMAAPLARLEAEHPGDEPFVARRARGDVPVADLVLVASRAVQVSRRDRSSPP